MFKVSSATVSVTHANAERSFGNTAHFKDTHDRRIDTVLNRDQLLYPLLQPMLHAMGLSLKPSYTCQDVAELFGVTTRTIQSRVADGTLASRKLIGRGRFLPKDLDDYLRDAGRPQE